MEADVPKCLAEWGQRHSATELDRAVGNLTLVAFYYLLWIGEYTIKDNRNETKQMVQFKREDITFFKRTGEDNYGASRAMRRMTLLLQPTVLR